MARPSPSEQTILITGASGFLASHLLRVFLTAGYNVRGTVRSASSIPKIQAAQGALSSRLTFAIVPDMAAPHAFDVAAQGVSGIIHSANPFNLNPTNNETELLQPALRGTINVLTAAASYAAPTLSRIVITSSFAAMLDLSKGYRPGYNYTEKDWNPATYEEAASSADGGFSYCASKALAEKAAWDWIAEHKPSFSMSTISPPWIFGPVINPITSFAHLNESTEVIWKLINGSAKAVPPTDFAGFANVRDVAIAHLKAYESSAAAGERFVIGSHFDYQTACDSIRSQFPELRDRVPEGTVGAGLLEKVYTPDGSKAERVLGLRYTDLQTTMRDTVLGLLEAEKTLGVKAE